MSVAPELTKRAFQIMDAMRRADTLEELDALAALAFAAVGLKWFSLARFFAPDRTPSTSVVQGRFEPEWAKRYVHHNYGGSSLIAREMLHRGASYSWSEVLTRSGRDAAQERILAEACELGLRDGLFTPLRWTDGSYAAVVTAGPSPELSDPLYRTIAEVLSSYYAHECRRLHARSLHARSLPAVVSLSPRQRDCIAWVRHGKSSTDIAELLGISPQTVEEHVAQACRKLGVRTRVQAAVEATLLGLI